MVQVLLQTAFLIHIKQKFNKYQKTENSSIKD